MQKRKRIIKSGSPLMTVGAKPTGADADAEAKEVALRAQADAIVEDALAKEGARPKVWQAQITIGAPELLAVYDGLKSLLDEHVAGRQPDQVAEIAHNLLKQLQPVARVAHAVLRGQIEQQQAQPSPTPSDPAA